jgi:uncharacterized membrane protein
MAAKWLTDLLGGQATNIITGIGETAKKFITTDQDRMAFELEQQKWEFEFKKLAMTAEQKYFEDTMSARDMYKADSSIQKILSLLFTVSFFGFMVFLLFMLQNTTLPPAQENLIFTMFGAISGIMVTIVGFYFGSSKGSSDKNEKLISAVREVKQP